MVGIKRLIVVPLMTTSTGVGCTLITAGVAFYALCRGVCAGERIDLAVIKPLLFTIRMAAKTGRTVPGVTGNSLMLFIHVALVVLVAIDTGELGIVCRIGMTLAATVPFAVVASGIYGKRFGVMVTVLGRPPTRIGSMAIGAVG